MQNFASESSCSRAVTGRGSPVLEAAFTSLLQEGKCPDKALGIRQIYLTLTSVEVSFVGHVLNACVRNILLCLGRDYG